MRAGYCERVIRKVEGGDCVSPETLEVIAMALSDQWNQIMVADLTQDSELAVLALADAIQLGDGFLSAKLTHRCSGDVVVDSSLASPSLPIRGTFHGCDGLVHWLTMLTSWMNVRGIVLGERVVLQQGSYGYIYFASEFAVGDEPANSFNLDLRVYLVSGAIARIVLISAQF